MAIVPDSDPHWARQNLTLCLCVCMCVYFGISVDMAMGRKNTRFGVATNHREIEGVIVYLCLLGFIILIKICIKTRSWTRDGFGDLIMHGEGVRHPTTSARRRLPSSMCSYVCLTKQNVGLFLDTNVSTLSGVHQLAMHTFDAVGFVILCSPFEYLVAFRVLGEAMARCTWNLNTIH